jgi:hypothetical protein
VYTPVVSPDAGEQFVTGGFVAPQHVPLADIDAGLPRFVTFAPRVAPVVVIADTVGDVTVGTAPAAVQVTVLLTKLL